MTGRLGAPKLSASTIFNFDWRDLPHSDTIKVAQESYQEYRQFISQKLVNTPGVVEVRMKENVFEDWDQFLNPMYDMWDFETLFDAYANVVREDLPIVIVALEWIIAFYGGYHRIHISFFDAQKRFQALSLALDRY